MLLEVLIAFTLVTLCILPLFYPLTGILKQQNEFITKIKLDHQVNLMYGNILAQLHANEIPWDNITNESRQPIKFENYSGYYFFKVALDKGDADKDSAYLLELNFVFTEELTYQYNLCIRRIVQ